jgi:hypothetical protein
LTIITMIAKKVLLIRLVVRKILNNNMMFENNIYRKRQGSSFLYTGMPGDCKTYDK